MAHTGHDDYREEFHGEHPHTYDHREPRYLTIGILGVATVVALILVTLGIQYYYENQFESETYRRVLSQPNWQLQDLHKKEDAELLNYGYQDKAKGTVRIPIDDAMRLVVQESAENRLKYPTNPYEVKSAAQLAVNPTGVSQPGAVAATAAQNQGATSSPNVQQSTTPQQPHK